MKSAKRLEGIHKVSMYKILTGRSECYQAKTAHIGGFLDVTLLFKSVNMGRGGETLAVCLCAYFMNGPLHTVPHIRS